MTVRQQDGYGFVVEIGSLFGDGSLFVDDTGRKTLVDSLLSECACIEAHESSLRISRAVKCRSKLRPS